MFDKNMPAGKYYVGDLCYVLHGSWNEVCDLTIDDNTVKSGVFKLKDGRQFAMWSTAFGDGTYYDYQGRAYSVDSGTIGCIKVDDLVSPSEKADLESTINAGLGQVIRFPEEFRTYTFEGEINFGNVHIDTDPEGDEDDGDSDEEPVHDPILDTIDPDYADSFERH